MKLGVMKDQLPASLALADRVFCYSGGSTGMSRRRWRRWRQGDDRCRSGQLIEHIASQARPGDHVLVMSNGGFGGIHDKLLARLAP